MGKFLFVGRLVVVGGNRGAYPDGNFAAISEAEQKVRDVTYRDGQLRSAEKLFFIPSDSIIGEHGIDYGTVEG